MMDKTVIIYYDWISELIGFGTSNECLIPNNIQISFKNNENISLNTITEKIKNEKFMHDKIVIKNMMWI